MVGNTPLAEVGGIYAKIECVNPCGSVKDRIAKFIIDESERRGLLKPGMRIVEATSGNTGIAFAYYGRENGYPVTIVMPEHMTEERKRIIRELGAELILCSREGSFGEAVEIRDRLAQEPSSFNPDQFSNELNVECHYQTTGQEIIAQLAELGLKADAFVAGVGTGGSLIGCGKALREAFPEVWLGAVEPDEAAVMSGGEAGVHGIFGIGDGFIPPIAGGANAGLSEMIDEVFRVSTDDALAAAHRLREGHNICVGISSGANFLAAQKLRERHQTVVTLFPDGYSKYESHGLCHVGGQCPFHDLCPEPIPNRNRKQPARIEILSSMNWLLALVLLPVAQSGSLSELAKPHDGQSRRATSTFREGADGRYDSKAFPKGDLVEKSNYDNFRVAAGQTHVLMDEKGPGVITHIWMTFLGPEPQGWAKDGSANHQDMLLRIYWDGSDKPGVEAPVGDFFANCFGKRSDVVSLPVIVEDADSYNCFWQMPFRKSARVEIVNQGDKPINLLYYNVDWVKKDSLPRDTPYFYAQYRQEYPAEKGKDYVLLDTSGNGHYVGTVLAVRTRSPMWFGEGDEKVYIDGEEKPSIWGTGTEDYFLSAWGLKKTSTPCFGVPFFDQWGIVGGHTSAYRWHINDPLVFQKGIKVTMEHFGWISPDENPDGKTNSWNEREDDYSSVALWYQTGTPTFSARAPSGKERHLSSLESVTAYARDFTDAKYHGAGEATQQSLDLYDGAQLLYMPKVQEGAWLEIPLRVEKKVPLRLLINATTSYDFGTYQASLDGIKLGEPMDLYSKEIGNAEFHLLDFWPEPGPHILRLECVGKNPASTGFFAGIESARLRERRPRVFEYGRDKDKDWKKAPTLYR